MKLKQIPEDFIVEEVPGFKRKYGQYNVFLMEKKDYTTEKAIQKICDSLHINRRDAGYAGIKDRAAITRQYISLKANRDKVLGLTLKDINLKFVSTTNHPISLGDHGGNRFEIVVRDVDKNFSFDTNKPVKNYFDKQRFSNNNADIGLAIIKGDFKFASELVCQNEGYYEDEVKKVLVENKNNYVGALQVIPRKILLLFIHAYQSKLFNEVAKQITSSENIKLPLVGFGTDYSEFENERVERLTKELLVKDGVDERSFIIRQFPDLSCEGEERDLYARPRDLVIGKLEDDELNKGKKKILIKFELPKGAYATNVVKTLANIVDVK